MFYRCVHITSVILLLMCAGLYATLGWTATPLSVATQQGVPEMAYVGTQQAQIQAIRLDTATGKLTVIGPVVQGPKSTWVLAHPDLPVLYSVDDDNQHEGTVFAYKVDRTTGALTQVNQVASGGKGTTNLTLDLGSMTLLAANYASGSVSSFAVNGDASVGARVSTVAETGSGPNRRQASAHAHNAVVDPSGHYVLVPDLGADRVFIYGFDRATHALTPVGAAADGANTKAFETPAGTGPRHLVFGPDGQFVYLLTELSGEVMVLHWDPAHAELTPVQSLPISSETFAGAKSGAEIEISQDGRFVYVEDRGENTFVVYRVTPGAGTLTLVQRIAAGGDRPWGFTIDPTGKWLLVANQHSGTVSVFGIDPAAGTLTGTGQSVAIPAAVAIAVVK